MNIKHDPVTDTKNAELSYSKIDGVPVKYVCTTELTNGKIGDVFYRDTPHPKFGNKYFALFWTMIDDDDEVLMITNADYVEKYSFGMVENDNGELEYSRSRHDYKSFDNGNMIDGGRDYIRSSGNVKVFNACDGTMTLSKISNHADSAN